MGPRQALACAAIAAFALASCGNDGESSPGTVVCDRIDVTQELERLQDEIEAAERAGDEDAAAMARTDQKAVAACDPDLVELWEQGNRRDGAGIAVLTDSGACGEAFFWAATPAGDRAVTVEVDAGDRSTSAPTEISFSVPAEDVEVEVLSGDDLAVNMCTDAIVESAQPTSTQGAAAGRGQIVIDPPDGEHPDMVRVSGTLTLEDLEAEDGTLFSNVEIRSDQIGGPPRG